MQAHFTFKACTSSGDAANYEEVSTKKLPMTPHEEPERFCFFCTLACTETDFLQYIKVRLSSGNEKCRQKEKRIFSSVSCLFSHLNAHRFHHCFGPVRLSRPSPLHPSLHLHKPFRLFPVSFLVSFGPFAVELNLQPATPGVPADVRSLALKRALASSPDAFATLCHCDIFAM
ncbi:hypothetical protein PAMA_010116 [Pampus argenteus]